MTQELTPDLVETAYRLMLGREPESEAVVQAALRYGTLASLRAAMLASPEFRFRLSEHVPVAQVPFDAPPLAVEVAIDAQSEAVLLAHVERTWSKLGREEPHWSVLSADRFRSANIKDSEDEFYASGAGDTQRVLATLRRNGIAPERLRRVVEYGCGLGRVTLHLAGAFDHVIACDISDSHLRYAESVLARSGVANVTYRLVDLDSFGMREPFDLWFSRIVLQHNPPPIMAMILRRALHLLAPDGIAMFQVPTYATGYRFDATTYLSEIAQRSGIEMHALPQKEVFAIAREAGCHPVEVREDDSVGNPHDWTSMAFVFQKDSSA